MGYNNHENNAGGGFPQPNQGFPGYPPKFFPAANPQYDPHYNQYYPHDAPPYGAGYWHQNPPQFQPPPPQFQNSPQFYQPRGYEPSSPTGNDGRIAVTNSNCGRATTSNFGNTTLTNSHNKNQGNHHSENYGRIKTRNSHVSRTTRVGDISSNGGNARASTSRNGFMTNANVRGGANHNSGYQNGGAGGAVNIGRGD